MGLKTVLAFDFGASSGRAVLAQFDGKQISSREIHRFSNDPVMVRGTLYWDVLRLFHEIKQGITKALHSGGFDCISIDTWGVDIGLIGFDGELVQNPVHYRDQRTTGMMEEVCSTISPEELYAHTGIQFMRINTLFQLYYLAHYRPELLERTDKLVMITDVFNYFLTGEIKTEYTNASTSQMLNANTGTWDTALLERLGIPTRILPEIIPAGSVYGTLSDELCEELGCPKVPVIASATHDTASAVVSVPAASKDFIYISCGTWSLFGTELPAPCLDEKALKHNFTNEGGVNHTIRFLKNIMGLWLIQESRRQWIREGFEVSYADLEREALACPAYRCFIDPDDPAFDSPGNLPKRVQEYCKKTGQFVPQTRGEVMRCIYESLAFKYRLTYEMLCDITGKKYSDIHLVGGGTKDTLLCRLTADACNIRVTGGPVEATVTGNIAVALMALGELSSIWQAREMIAASFEPVVYLPQPKKETEDAYRRFLAAVQKQP